MRHRQTFGGAWSALSAVVLIAACSHRTVRVEYARAQPIVDEPVPAPPTIAIAGGVLNPGDVAPAADQLLKLPDADDEAKASEASYAVIDKANRESSDDPEATTYFNAIQVYQFDPGRLYQIYTAPFRITDIALRPGEKIVGEPAAGDTVQWAIARGKSMEGGVEQQHIYLKPFRPGLHTNLIINTDQRTYLCLIHSYKETFMAGVKWRYPREEAASMSLRTDVANNARKSSSKLVSLDALNMRYVIEVIEGNPRWKPIQVFDDGAKTIIRFPTSMSVREAPALFVLRNDETQLVNYRVRPRPGLTGVDFEIDRLIDRAELRLGQDDDAEVVQITREGRHDD
jgi:P-type conjugative transfer protein TrbG